MELSNVGSKRKITVGGGHECPISHFSPTDPQLTIRLYISFENKKEKRKTILREKETTAHKLRERRTRTQYREVQKLLLPFVISNQKIKNKK